MGSLSNYAENKWLDHILKTAAFTVPSNVYIGLSTADPGEAGSGLAEPSGNAYARKACNAWDAAASRATANTNDIAYDRATGTWGTITHYALFDAITGGNMLGYGSLPTPKPVVAGNEMTIEAGDMNITVNAGGFSNYAANKMLDHMLKVTSYTPATHLYVGYSTANPGDSGSGLAEPSGNGYARVEHDAWDAAASGATSNTTDIEFPAASGGSWGTLTYTVVFDASTSGNQLLYGSITPSQACPDGDTMVFDAGDFDVSLN